MKNFGNPKRVSSLFTFMCVCMYVCARTWTTPTLLGMLPDVTGSSESAWR